MSPCFGENTEMKLNGDGHHRNVKAQSGLTAHERQVRIGAKKEKYVYSLPDLPALIYRLVQEEDRGEEESIEAVMTEARLTVHEP